MQIVQVVPGQRLSGAVHTWRGGGFRRGKNSPPPSSRLRLYFLFQEIEAIGDQREWRRSFLQPLRYVPRLYEHVCVYATCIRIVESSMADRLVYIYD